MSEQIRAGDKIRPILARVPSSDNTSAVEDGEIVTARMVGGRLLVLEEKPGMYPVASFKKAKTSAQHEEARRNSITPTKVAPQTAPAGNRKSVRKSFERRTGRELEWRDGHLCYAGTNDEVPDAPHIPSDKPQKN